MTLKEAKAKIEQLTARVNSLEDQLKFRSSLELGKGKGGAIDFATTLNERIKIMEDSIRMLSQSGATFAKGGQLHDALEAAVTTLDNMIGQGNEGAEAFHSLSQSFEQFNKLADEAGTVTKNLAGDLSAQAALLKRLGLSYGEFSKNIDMAIYSFSQSASEVQNINLQVKKLSETFGMLPAQVSQNFRKVAMNLAYDFGQIKEQFVSLQTMASKTGVSIDSLMGKFGRPMDTISGASDMAAKLNSLLGRNAFSATELLMMDEAQRAETIRGALQQGGVAQQALAGGVAGKFAMQSAQEVLGMSLDETRRFLSGEGFAGEPSDSLKASMAGRFQDPKDTAEMFKESFKDPATDLKTALDDLKFTIRQQQASVFNRNVLAARERMLTARPGTDDYRTATSTFAAGLLSRLGPNMQGFDSEEIAGAMMIGRPDEIEELLRLTEAGNLSDAEAKSILTDLDQAAKTGNNRRAALNRLSNALTKARVRADDVDLSELAGAQFGPEAGMGQERLLRTFRDAPARNQIRTKTIKRNPNESDASFNRRKREERERAQREFERQNRRKDNFELPEVQEGSDPTEVTVVVPVFMDGQQVAEATAKVFIGGTA